MTDLAFSRRHLFKAAGIVAAGVLGKTMSARAMTWGDNYKYESLAGAQIPLEQYALDYRNVAHCYAFQGGVGCNLPQTEYNDAFLYAQANHDPFPGPSCFLKGTNIRTAAGERPIEEFDFGDSIQTLSNGVQPIEQVFHYIYPKPWSFALQPVRISKNALADGVPSRDLIVSQEHAVMVDGELVTADSLINGTTILQHTVDCDPLEYYHIALANPDIREYADRIAGAGAKSACQS